jgi:hypothetical protein
MRERVNWTERGLWAVFVGAFALAVWSDGDLHDVAKVIAVVTIGLSIGISLVQGVVWLCSRSRTRRARDSP